MFVGTWAEIKEASFLACLLVYGPRPNRRQVSFDDFLDALFIWDNNVIEYLMTYNTSPEAGVLANRSTLLRDYLSWLEVADGEG